MTIPMRQVCGRASTRAVLDFAWQRGPIRADDVMAGRGLTRATSLQALDALLTTGLVEEIEPEPAPRMGRPARHFRFRGDAGYLVGVDAGGHRVNVAVADLTGTLLAVHEPATAGGRDPAPLDPQWRRERTLELIDDGLAAVGAGREDVAAVAVGVPAPVDAEGRSPSDELGFWQGMNAGFQEFLEQWFPVVRVDNDASLAALAEGRVGAAQGSTDHATLLAGWRFGTGIVVDGPRLRGRAGAVGEMGGLRHVEGVRGAEGLSQVAVTWMNDRHTPDDLPPGHPWRAFWAGGERAELLLEHARPGDPVTGELIDVLGDRLARTCAVLASFFVPERIVVCGATAHLLGPVIERTQALLPGLLEMPSPTVLASDLGARVVCVGATVAAQEAARSTVLDWAVDRTEAGHPLRQNHSGPVACEGE